ncbi:MAG: hypothetical protein PHT77_05465 [Bacteroidales bacterium]|nr:hypothetical protein [Bacteroidales bacterium]
MRESCGGGIEMNEIEDHQNPTILRSVRHTIPATDTMQKYYGEIKRNADAAYVLCGNEGVMCNERIEGCEFKSGNWCNLIRVMEFMGMR